MFKNKIFNLVIDIKNDYISKFGTHSLYEKGEETSCVINWVKKLDCEKYNMIFDPIQTNQYIFNDSVFVLIRYGQYTDVFGGESEYSFSGFWDLYDKIYRECRSIVIDVKNEKIAILPFDKFFNLNEKEETSIELVRERINNAKSVEISDKLDGSLQALRYYNNDYIMCGSQAIDPENSWRLSDGYKLLTDNIKMLAKDYSDYTLIFEFITKEDAHVVVYGEKDYGLHLIGMRNHENGEILTYKEVIKLANEYNILTTEVFDRTLDDVINNLDEKKSNEKEGFVLNIDSFQVKIKYNDYLAMHNILSAISSINLIIKHIGDNTFDDMISKIPDAYKNRVLEVAKKVYKYNNVMKCNISYWAEALDFYEYTDLKDKMIYITNYVPKEYQGYVREYAKTGKIADNYVKKKNGGYKKMYEIEETIKLYEELC